MDPDDFSRHCRVSHCRLSLAFVTAALALSVSGCGSSSTMNSAYTSDSGTTNDGATGKNAGSSSGDAGANGDAGLVTSFKVKQTNLVADTSGIAPTTDANLLNPWGLVANPTAGFFWVSDNHTGLATVYPPTGGASILSVSIPPPEGTDAGVMGAPTGQVFNGTAADFKGDKFIIDTEDGTLVGWQSGTSAVLRVDQSSDSGYKGLALVTNRKKALLVAANFHKGTVDVFDDQYAPVANPGFTDATIPAGFAPFNVASLEGNVYIAYAKQDADKADDEKGAGHGYVNVFKPDGTRIKRLISQGELDSPWGLEFAPASWGALAHTLLVANFGDGKVHAYDPDSGALVGTLADTAGTPLVIDGLWALTVGPKAPTDLSDMVFFTAGPGDEEHGLFGQLAAP